MSRQRDREFKATLAVDSQQPSMLSEERKGQIKTLR